MADKYTDAEIEALGKKGHAFKNPDGHYSYPIDDVDDLDNAIKAVGRGGADHDAIRKYVIGRAKAMGKSSMIPGTWNADGSLSESKTASRSPGWEQRRRRWAGSLLRQPGRRSMRFARGCLEVRAKPDGTGGTNFQFLGYGATFNDAFQMWDPWGDEYDEEVEPGAFTETLAFPGLDTPFLIGHNDMGIPMARTTNGTMHLSQDGHGLPVDALLSGRRQDVRDLADAVDRGDIDEMSIGFVTRGQHWSEDWSKRYMTNLDLHRGDVSVVALAANAATKGASMTSVPVSEAAASRRPQLERRMPTAPYTVHDGENNQCPQCTSMNDQDAYFCDQCGAKMPGGPKGAAVAETGGDHTHQCQDCLSMNATDAKFCDQCGSDLAGVRAWRKPGGGYAGYDSDWASKRPGERRAQSEIVDMSTHPDFNLPAGAANAPAYSKASHGSGSLTCPHDNCPVYAGGDGDRALNAQDAKFCDQCGGPLYDNDGLIVLDDNGVVQEVDGDMADADLLSRRLWLLEHA